MREGRLVSNLLVVSVVVIQQECRQKSRGSFSFLSRCVLCFQFYPPCVGRFQFIPQWADKIEKCEWFIITETTLLFSIYARPTELFQMRPNWKGRVSGIISISSARECCRPTYYFNFFRAIRNKMKVPESTVYVVLFLLPILNLIGCWVLWNNREDTVWSEFLSSKSTAV